MADREKKEKITEAVVIPAVEEVKIPLSTYESLKGLAWPAKARLEHYLQVNKTENEKTVTEWDQILTTI